MPAGKGAPGRGRPRDAALDERILDEFLTLLAARGYTRLTLDELATRAGVAKTTILRRWPSKAAVTAAGLQRLALQSVAIPDSGSLESDLNALLHGVVETFVRGRGQFVPRLLLEAGHRPEITDLILAVIHTRRQAYRRVLASAIARAELAPTIDQELLIDLLIGPIWTRMLVTRDPITDEYVGSIVQAVLAACGVKGPHQPSERPTPQGDGPDSPTGRRTATRGRQPANKQPQRSRR